MKFKLAGEVAHSFVNGPGIRYVVFFQGCTHACPGCHNPETHDIDAGEMADTTEVISRIGSAKYLDGITLSGGDPFLQPEACAQIARAAKDMGLCVWAYSGWTFDQLVQDEKCREALRYIDTLVDGPFIESRMIQDSEKCLWRGSENQRLIATQASLRAMHGIELKDLMQKRLDAVLNKNQNNSEDIIMEEIKTLAIKRNGDTVAYNAEKIMNAIAEALIATGEVSTRDVSTMAQITTLMVEREITSDISKAVDGVIKVSVEEIQDLVEAKLMAQSLTKTAKAYILYRAQHAKVRDAQRAILDVKKTIEDYVGPDKDWRVKENATVTLSLGGLILSNSGAITANYWLNEVYDQEIAEAHRSGQFHIHDLSMLAPYCAGWSLKQLLIEGLGGVEGRITSAPAAHLSTLCNQMVNFLGIMQNEWAGAQAFSSVDTYLAPFVKHDNLTYNEVKQCIQSLVYGVNTPSRWGTQPPFSNVTMDWVIPKDMENLPAIVKGKDVPFTYGECKRELDMVNKAFIEVMLEGDANGRGFQYPIPTYSITKDFDWSATENNKLLFSMAAKYGTPYFSNYINSDMEPSDVRSMCCRLRLDLRELRKKSGVFFGSGESTGSIGVVTINLPRLAYQAATEAEFYERLDRLMDVAARSLDTKRKVCTRLMNEGLYPYTKRYLGNFDNHFSTIGLIGMNEAALNARWLRTNMGTPEGQAFGKAVLNHMRERLSYYQERYGALFNLEATPAEGTTYRFAKHDKAQFSDIITAAKEGHTPFYTNSSHLPVSFTDDVFKALDLQDGLQTLYTSGTVFHAFLGEKLPDWEAAAKLVKVIAENYKLPYYTLSPTYSVCVEHGYITGEVDRCPYCGRETEIYSRITGYYRPLKNWNDGKTEEFKNRKEYDDPTATLKDVPCAPYQVSVKAVQDTAPQTGWDGVHLFATRTCPNCKLAKQALDEAGISYDVVYAEVAPELARSLGVKTAPTLVVVSGGKQDLYSNMGGIVKYISMNRG